MNKQSLIQVRDTVKPRVWGKVLNHMRDFVWVRVETNVRVPVEHLVRPRLSSSVITQLGSQNKSAYSPPRKQNT